MNVISCSGKRIIASSRVIKITTSNARHAMLASSSIVTLCPSTSTSTSGVICAAGSKGIFLVGVRAGGWLVAVGLRGLVVM